MVCGTGKRTKFFDQPLVRKTTLNFTQKHYVLMSKGNRHKRCSPFKHSKSSKNLPMQLYPSTLLSYILSVSLPKLSMYPFSELLTYSKHLISITTCFYLSSILIPEVLTSYVIVGTIKFSYSSLITLKFTTTKHHLHGTKIYFP